MNLYLRFYTHIACASTRQVGQQKDCLSRNSILKRIVNNSETTPERLSETVLTVVQTVVSFPLFFLYLYSIRQFRQYIIGKR